MNHSQSAISGCVNPNRTKATPTFRAAVLVAVVGIALPTVGSAEIPLDLSYVDQNSDAYFRFKDYVDRAVGGDPGFDFQATNAAWMYNLTGQSPYCELAVDVVQDQVDEANAAIAGGSRPPVAGDSYLHSGKKIGDVALAISWCSQFTTAAQRQEWTDYAQQTVWNIWNHENASWGGNPFPWSGWGTDKPGNNYHYNFLTATMYWGLHWAEVSGGSSEWVDLLSQDLLPDLVQYFQGMSGGGSREGTGYGLAQRHLFGIYRLWEDATGEDLGAASTHRADTIDYWIHATVPTLDQFAPIGDQARSTQPDVWDYNRHIMFEGQMPGNEPHAGRASDYLEEIPNQQMQARANYRFDLFPIVAEPGQPLGLVWHATGVGHLFARTDWTPEALWFSYVAGPYELGHAHQDQGAFTLFKNGWQAVTANIHTRSGIEQGPEVHNVLRFVYDNTTIRQRHRTVSTMMVTPRGDGVDVTSELAPAFDDPALVSSWQRDLSFDRTGLMIHDTFDVASGVEAIWQINSPTEPTIEPDGTVLVGNLRIIPVIPANPQLTVVDWTQMSSNFESGYKLEIRGGDSEYLVVVQTDDSLFADGFESGDISRWN